MPLLKTLLNASLAVTTLVAASIPVVFADDGTPKMVRLPVEGPLFMRETSTGDTVIISADGRFVMPGRMVDRQADHTVISTIEGAQKAFGELATGVRAAEGGPDHTSELTSNGFPDHEKLLSFSVGHGPKVAYVWVDPLCPYCHRVVEMQDHLAEEFTFHNLIVPILGERSEAATDALACLPEDQRRMTMMSNQYSRSGGDCDERSLANSQRLATVMQVQSVPTIISPNRQSVTGAPSNVLQLEQFLKGEI